MPATWRRILFKQRGGPTPKAGGRLLDGGVRSVAVLSLIASLSISVVQKTAMKAAKAAFWPCSSYAQIAGRCLL